MSQLTADDLNEIKRAAIQTGLADPTRRSLLLAWLPREITTRLPRSADPASQLQSDLYWLLDFEAKHRQPALSIWLENAERLTEIYPGVPALFAAARRRLTQGATLDPEAPKVTDAAPEPTSAVHPSTPSVAAAATAQIIAEPQPLERIEVMLIASHTLGDPLRLGDEARDIRNALETGLARDRLSANYLPSLRPIELQRELQRCTAHVLHFGGHGVRGGALVFQNQLGGTVEAEPDNMRALIELAQEYDADFRIAFFNACHSADMAEKMVRSPAVVACAIGTSDSVDDDVALTFSKGFYTALADGKDVLQAFRSGRIQVGFMNALVRGQKDWFQIFLADRIRPEEVLLRARPPVTGVDE